MRRIGRRVLLAFLTVVSVTAACLSAFTYTRRNDTVTWSLQTVARTVELESGDVSAATEQYFLYSSAGQIGVGHQGLSATWIPPIVDGKPFQVLWDPIVTFPVLMPSWLLCPVALATGAPVAFAIRRAIAMRRRVGGRMCVTCGYDLRATPDRCPEGGNVPQPQLN